MSPLAHAFAAGSVLGVGLVVAGMTRPHKIIGFLDVGGTWDPSLALVMGAALAVYAWVRRSIRLRPRPLIGERFHEPARRDLDRRLLAGAALFGAGWGLAGYCPGPAVVSLGPGGAAVWTFGAAMLAGMGLFHLVERARVARGS